MLSYIARRLPTAALTVVLTSVVVFLLIGLLPGSPASVILGDQADPAAVAALEQRMGLDRPMVQQYADWARRLVTGDLGTSYISGAPIAGTLGAAAGATAELALASLIVTALTGAAFGIAAATARRRATQAVIRGASALIFGVPEYVLGILLILLFAITVRLLPAGGREPLLADPEIGIQYLAMPAIALGLHSGVVVGRFLETELRRQLEEEYLDTARAKGVSARRVLWRHALPNALPPVVTVLGMRVGHVLGGAVVIEAVFAWPGLGQVLANAVVSHDYLIIQDMVVYFVVVFIAVQVGGDLIHAALDPRVRLEGEAS
ncbi:ABC transporter permease [Nonomuraea sp. NBC_00507]|uniref:ABC transporter permease n=1 Tax=Nonomuraea sp. NBC_00507 TaxID=2976002 RepID=UPI002E171D13